MPSLRARAAALFALVGLLPGLAMPAQAYLFWNHPTLAEGTASPDDPKMVIPLAGANPKEQQANLVWALRAGLNVAALQCQFAPQLRTVANYNNMLRQHAVELQQSYAALSAYFKRTAAKSWQTALDQYTTRTYNSFSTLQAQMIFCETAASVGRETLVRPKGELGQVAVTRLRELRSSLIPTGDTAFAFGTPDQLPITSEELDPICFDKKGRIKACPKPKR